MIHECLLPAESSLTSIDSYALMSMLPSLLLPKHRRRLVEVLSLKLFTIVIQVNLDPALTVSIPDS